jgi:outer membrane murein-binding lipoprotein Lpp
MFELNLIKDKAKARQRRRVIFLSIVSILLLAGLLSIFVGSLFWRETTKLKQANKEVEQISTKINTMNADLNVREPAARKRRNALIEAWKEDVLVRQDRPYFTPILKDIVKHHPGQAKFWYNQIVLTTNSEGGGPRGPQANDELAASKALMGTRGLEANGYIQIENSDILTESELAQLAHQMDGMLKLVGEPKFTLDVSNEIVPGGDAEASRYVPFTMRAAQTQFSGRESP